MTLAWMTIRQSILNKDRHMMRQERDEAQDAAAVGTVLPIASSRCCKEIASRDFSGRLTKIEIRFDNIRNASANASRRRASDPVAAAGSGSPQ